MPRPTPMILALLALSLAVALAGPAAFAQQPQPMQPADVVAALEAALVEAIARAEPSVVAIARIKEGRSEETTAVRGRGGPIQQMPADPPAFNAFRGGGFDDFANDEDMIASDYGSGVVIGENGEMLTTFHVVKGANRLVVRAKGTREFLAEVIAADPRSDLAVIVPREPTPRRHPELKPLPMGDAGKLRKGNFLLALGNPFNAGRDGRASASWGILSNISRRLELPSSSPENYKRQLRNYPTLLQLDAKLNLGMSGGAVVNLKGELVGLTTNAANAGGFDSQAGYALPIDVLSRRAIDALKQGKEVEYGFLGIGLSEDGSNRISNVAPGTPAGEGGLLINDAVLSVGGLPVVDSDTLVIAVNSFTPGNPITIRVRRDDKEFDKTVSLSKLPVYGEVISTVKPNPWRGIRVDFVSTNPRAARGNDVLDAMARGGVLITEIVPGSNADDAGLKPGQVITKVDGQAIRTPAEFARVVVEKRSAVTLTTEGDRDVVVK